jgi:4-hydroxyacetophenone monooxygenase
MSETISTLRRALELADANALRLAIYRQTRDAELLAMRVHTVRRVGSAFAYTALAPEDEERVREKAFAFLSAPCEAQPDAPTTAEAAKLMEAFAGRPLSAADIGYAWEDMDFEPFVRGAAWSLRPSQEVLDRYSVTIIGAGFSGLLAAIQMQRLGLKFRIVERQAGAGGTWFLNDYPEARVDVPSMLYQYKFESGYKWRSFFATQAELLEYFDHIIRKYDLREAISTNTKLVSARWSDARAKWRIELDGPAGHEVFDTDFLISASGQFSTPRLPDIEGIESFRGAIFHTTNWDHDFDFTGKRVAVIGNGSTGSQLLRGVAARASHVTVYQRTPNWITRTPGYRDEVPIETHWLFDRLPDYRRWVVFGLHIAQLQIDGLHDLDPEWRAQGGLISEKNDNFRESLKRYIRREIGDDEALCRSLTPDYAPLARRLVVDNDWYRTLKLDHVDLKCGAIRRMTETGIVSDDGTERAFDLIVLGAGFDVERFLWPAEYVGRGGQTPQSLWEKDGARGYLALMLPGFPNFAMMYGPNAGILSGSFHSWIENYTRYFCKLITTTIERGARAFELKRSAFDDYNGRLDEALKKKLFEAENGGGGYYINSHGRPGVSMPWTLQEFYQMIREPDFDAYRFD